MIKITINDMVNVFTTLKDLMDKNFSGSNAFKVARLMRELTKEMEVFDKSRMQVVEKYTLRDDRGNPVVDENGNIKIKPDQIIACNTEFSQLLNGEIELNASKLNESVLAEIGDITPAQAMALEPVIDFEE